MAGKIKNGMKLVSSINPKTVLAGGLIIIGVVAAYELLKGNSSSSQSAGTTSTPVSQNPNQSLGTSQQGSTSTTTPAFTLNPSSNYSLPSTTTIHGNRNYTITSVYAPYNSSTSTDVYAPVTTTTTTTSNSLDYAPYNYSATSTNNNQKYQYSYSTGGGLFGSGGYNFNSPNSLIGLNGEYGQS